MTVAELVAALREQRQDAEVLGIGYEDGYDGIERVELDSVVPPP